VVVVIDTETTTDHAQALLVGAYRILLVNWVVDDPEVTCVEEGLFVPDSLTDEHPDFYSVD
jgi:hypothetical protein